jgi:TatD DNase family protein
MESKLLISEAPVIETHCHLDYLEPTDLEQTLAFSNSVNIEKIITIAVSPDNLDEVLRLAKLYPQVYCTQGIHPHESKFFNADVEKKIRQNCLDKKVVAVGEIGLDYHYNHSLKDTQMAVFERQLEIAVELNLPVVIHTREADEDCSTILNKYAARLNRKGVLHSFTSSVELAKTAIDLGFYIGFNGIITFKNAGNVREVLKATPLSRIIFETDSPYLTPVPFRGVKNHPYYLPFIIKEASTILGLSPSELTKLSTSNAKSLFDLSS